MRELRRTRERGKKEVYNYKEREKKRKKKFGKTDIRRKNYKEKERRENFKERELKKKDKKGRELWWKRKIIAFRESGKKTEWANKYKNQRHKKCAMKKRKNCEER